MINKDKWLWHGDEKAFLQDVAKKSKICENKFGIWLKRILVVIVLAILIFVSRPNAKYFILLYFTGWGMIICSISLVLGLIIHESQWKEPNCLTKLYVILFQMAVNT